MTDPDPSSTTRTDTAGLGDRVPPPTADPAPPPPPQAPSSEAAAPPPGGTGWASVPAAGKVARTRSRDPGRTASLILGLILVGVGLWFFAKYTLGLDLPAVRWSQLWPLILIIIGGWILLGSMRRGSR
jgi:hypothetical protein